MSEQVNQNPHEPTLVLPESVAILRSRKDDFYALLPRPKILNGSITKEDIDEAQSIAEAIETLRLRIRPTFTAEELQNGAKFPYKTLQAIAKTNNIPANQSGEKLIAALDGQHKSLRVRQETLKKVFGRLKWARRVKQYPHSRQQTQGASSDASSSLSPEDINNVFNLILHLSKEHYGAQIIIVDQCAQQKDITNVDDIVDSLIRKGLIRQISDTNLEIV